MLITLTGAGYSLGADIMVGANITETFDRKATKLAGLVGVD